MPNQEIYNIDVLRCWYAVPSIYRDNVKMQFIKLDKEIAELKRKLNETTSHAYQLQCVHDYIEQAEDNRARLIHHNL